MTKEAHMTYRMKPTHKFTVKFRSLKNAIAVADIYRAPHHAVRAHNVRRNKTTVTFLSTLGEAQLDPVHTFGGSWACKPI